MIKNVISSIILGTLLSMLISSCSIYSIHDPDFWPERGTENTITDFSFLAANNENSLLSTDVASIINENLIEVNLPFGTVLTELVATFSTTGTEVKVSTVEQNSGITSNNFSSDVTYTVAAKNGTTRDYIIRVYISVNRAQLDTMIAAGNDITRLDTSGISDMSNLFYNYVDFNQDIGNWDVGNVTNMAGMFREARTFNQDIGDWNVSNVTNMNNMFCNARIFNSDISDWNVGNVTDMTRMFYDANAFNVEIGEWNVSNVTSMMYMFWRATSFNQNIKAWAEHLSEDGPDISGFSTGGCPLSTDNHPYDSWD